MYSSVYIILLKTCVFDFHCFVNAIVRFEYMMYSGI